MKISLPTANAGVFFSLGWPGPRQTLNMVVFGSIFVFLFNYRALLAGSESLTHDAIIWYGTYHYFVDAVLNGNLPLWNPYGQSGNVFYSAISLLGLLDPLVFLNILFLKLFSFSILQSYLYFHIGRLIVMAVGAYFLFRHVAGSSMAAKIGSTVFFFALFSSSLHQNGFVNLFAYTPLALYFLLRYWDGLGELGNARNLYIAAIFLGVTLNIYIPVYAAGYLVIFFLFSLITGAMRLGRFREKLAERQTSIRRLAKELVLGLLFLSLFALLPLSVYLVDLGPEGELYPILRVFSSQLQLPPQMVSEAGTGALEGAHYLRNHVYGTFLNLTQLIAPEYWRLRFNPAVGEQLQETYQFIGILGLLLIFAFLPVKSRFRYAALLTTGAIALLMTSFVTLGPISPWHEIFVTILPFLKLVKVFESFLGVHLLNLCMLLTIGLAACEHPRKLKRGLMRLDMPFAFLVVGLLVLAASYYYLLTARPDYPAEKFTAIHSMAAIYLIGAVAFWVAFARIMRGRPQIILLVFVSIMFMELLYYNLPGQLRDRVLIPNPIKPDDLVVHGIQPDVYKDYRHVLSAGYLRFSTYHPALMKQAFLLPCLCHHWASTLFVPKNYYEFLTHLPPGALLAAGGVTAPIARFFTQAFFSADKREILRRMGSLPDKDLRDNIVFIESDPAGRPDEKNRLNPVLHPRQVPPSPVVLTQMGNALSPMAQWVQNPHFSQAFIHNKNFSINSVTFQVDNPESGYFYYADSWSKYWKANVDGKPARLFKANHNYKAVYLEPGSHEVSFEFRPAHFIYALYLYLAALAAGFAVLGWHLLQWYPSIRPAGVTAD